jgi:hypothetical protein
VPPEHAQQLFGAYGGADKQLEIVPGGHIMAIPPDGVHKVAGFLREKLQVGSIILRLHPRESASGHPLTPLGARVLCPGASRVPAHGAGCLDLSQAWSGLRDAAVAGLSARPASAQVLLEHRARGTIRWITQYEMSTRESKMMDDDDDGDDDDDDDPMVVAVVVAIMLLLMLMPPSTDYSVMTGRRTPSRRRRWCPCQPRSRRS